jgi:hypothetical protein
MVIFSTTDVGVGLNVNAEAVWDRQPAEER